MNEDFVPYEIAIKLKEKGFNKKCFAQYFPVREKVELSYEPKEMYLDAPTIGQVLKWLREERKIYIAIDFFLSNGNTEVWWIYTIRYIEDDSTEDIFESCRRKSFNEAAIAGIEYVIDNLI